MPLYKSIIRFRIKQYESILYRYYKRLDLTTHFLYPHSANKSALSMNSTRVWSFVGQSNAPKSVPHIYSYRYFGLWRLHASIICCRYLLQARPGFGGYLYSFSVENGTQPNYHGTPQPHTTHIQQRWIEIRRNSTSSKQKKPKCRNRTTLPTKCMKLTLSL